MRIKSQTVRRAFLQVRQFPEEIFAINIELQGTSKDKEGHKQMNLLDFD